MKRILVIGATGTVGGQVAVQLTHVPGIQVRAFVRNPDKAALPSQVQVVTGDLTVPETLDSALEGGVDAVFVVWVAPLDAFAPVLTRIASQTRRLVLLSAPLKTPHPLFQQPNPSRTKAERLEEMIENSALSWTFLRPGMFAANAIGWWAPQIRTGSIVRWPYLATPTAPIDERDTAAVAVRALCQDGHERAEYVLTGPQSLSQREQIETIGRMIGRSLRVEEISPDEWLAELPSRFPPVVARFLLEAWAAASGQPALVTSTVQQITANPARTFAEWVSAHAAAFR